MRRNSNIHYIHVCTPPSTPNLIIPDGGYRVKSAVDLKSGSALTFTQSNGMVTITPPAGTWTSLTDGSLWDFIIKLTAEPSVVVPHSAMTATAASADANHPASDAVDGDYYTYFSNGSGKSMPQSLVLNLGGSVDIRYVKVQNFEEYPLLASGERRSGGDNPEPGISAGPWGLWCRPAGEGLQLVREQRRRDLGTAVKSGTLGNQKGVQQIYLDPPATGAYLKLEVRSNHANSGDVRIANIDIIADGAAQAIATTTTAGTSANPATAGASVTLTATVAPASGATVPTGSVQFQVDGVNVGSPVTVTAGTPSPNGTAALVTTAPTVAGSHTVTAVYTATGGFNGSSGSASLTVNPATATALVFTTAPGAAYAGSAFGTQPVVKTRDAYGNNSTVGLAAGKTVTIAIKTGTGTLSGTTTYDIGTGAGNGTITGSGLAIDTAGSFTLSATAPDLTEGDSASFTVQAADANRLTNPGFETGTPPRWTVREWCGERERLWNHSAWRHQDIFQLQVDYATLSQTVALSAGNYSLSMWIASRADAGNRLTASPAAR